MTRMCLQMVQMIIPRMLGESRRVSRSRPGFSLPNKLLSVRFQVKRVLFRQISRVSRAFATMRNVRGGFCELDATLHDSSSKFTCEATVEGQSLEVWSNIVEHCSMMCRVSLARVVCEVLIQEDETEQSSTVRWINRPHPQCVMRAIRQTRGPRPAHSGCP